jgi:transposase
LRGQQERSGSLFSYVSIEERIPASHPLRRIRKLADQALDRLNPTFCALYASEGRPSVPPEQQLLASLLQAFYGIRSERSLLEQLNYNLLFRWIVGLSPDDPILHPTTFTKNRERLLNDDVMGRFLEKLLGSSEVNPLLSDEHSSVDGTLLQAWASHASLERMDGQDDRRLRHQDEGKDSVLPRTDQNVPRVISAASSSATRLISPALIPTHCCAGNPMPIQHCQATGAICSWTTIKR